VPITPYLAGQAFDPETIMVMSAVLEKVCAELGIKSETGRKNPAAEFIAEKIIRHAQRGARTQAALYLATMADFKQGNNKPH
jgi:hypothetical protein